MARSAVARGALVVILVLLAVCRSPLAPAAQDRDHSFSAAYSINVSGQVVGMLEIGEGGPQAVLWEGEDRSYLGNLPGAQESTAWDINASGQAVGVSGIDLNGGEVRAVLWDGEQNIELGRLPGGSATAAYAINDRGQVVGQPRTPMAYNAQYCGRAGG